jgi:hypothetical protein
MINNQFADNVVALLLEDEDGNLYELKDTGAYKIWSQFEQGKIFKKGNKVD